MSVDASVTISYPGLKSYLNTIAKDMNKKPEEINWVRDVDTIDYTANTWISQDEFMNKAQNLYKMAAGLNMAVDGTVEQDVHGSGQISEATSKLIDQAQAISYGSAMITTAPLGILKLLNCGLVPSSVKILDKNVMAVDFSKKIPADGFGKIKDYLDDTPEARVYIGIQAPCELIYVNELKK